jgi:hypothetical protein
MEEPTFRRWTRSDISKIEGSMFMLKTLSDFRNPLTIVSGFACVLLISGCGGSDAPAAAGRSETPAESAAPAGASGSSPSNLITASIENPVQAEQPDEKAPAKAPEDEVVVLLREAQQLRISPVTGSGDEEKKIRRSRNEQIVDLSTKVLTLTMNDKSREPQFNQAIGQLLEARFQMALAGTQEDVEQFYADVQTLNDRDPKSPAAAEGVYRIARFVHTKAGLLGKSQPEWFEQLSRWAREFASRFPEYGQRPGQIAPAVTLLFGAARSCELHAVASTDPEVSSRLMTEAKLCYTAMAKDFPKTVQGQEAAAVLRRIALKGQKLSQFSGPTADGGMISADEFTGKPTLIYFWASDDAGFEKGLLPMIQKISDQAGSDRLRIIGVALDEDETVLEQFLESHKVPGKQIFFTHPEQRSWNSPLIRFWGISRSPSIWVVNADGVVVSTSVAPEELIATLKPLVK